MANVKAIVKQLEMQYPDTNRDQGGTVASLSTVVVGDVRPILLTLLTGAGLLLLIASVNVASLRVGYWGSSSPKEWFWSPLGPRWA